MKNLIIGLLLLNVSLVQAQRFNVESGSVRFFSEALIENIEATNSEVKGIVDVPTSEFAFVVPIKSFEFAKDLMKEHFNENYLESDKFKNASFAGTIDSNFEAGTINVSGEFTIHGVKKKYVIPITIKPEGDYFHITSTFMVRVADHKIKIPKLMFQNIAEVVEVTVDLKLKK